MVLFVALNATTRDYARFGWLYLNGGKSPADGSEVVPEEWVRSSVTPDGAHVQPGPQNTVTCDRAAELGYPQEDLDAIAAEDLGYGYQWWIPGLADEPDIVAGDYLAIGVYGQFIYVSPQHEVVVAMNCAYAVRALILCSVGLQPIFLASALMGCACLASRATRMEATTPTARWKQ